MADSKIKRAAIYLFQAVGSLVAVLFLYLQPYLILDLLLSFILGVHSLLYIWHAKKHKVLFAAFALCFFTLSVELAKFYFNAASHHPHWHILISARDLNFPDLTMDEFIANRILLVSYLAFHTLRLRSQGREASPKKPTKTRLLVKSALIVIFLLASNVVLEATMEQIGCTGPRMNSLHRTLNKQLVVIVPAR